MIKIADIGINHDGNLGIAISLAKTFAPHVDYIKLQMRTPEECVPKGIWENKKVNPFNKDEMTYLQYKKENELSEYDLEKFKLIMERFNIKWFSSVWDVSSLYRLLKIHPEVEYIKIPSAKCHSKELSDEILKLGIIKKIIVSLGDNKNIYAMFENYMELWNGAIPSYCLPVYGNNLYIPQEIIMFKALCYTTKTMYSTHSGRLRDIEFAKTLGYDFVEFHITHSKGLLGSDHSSSFNLHQIQTLEETLKGITERINTTREEIWDDIDKKLETLR